jgi:hypothetical protein
MAWKREDPLIPHGEDLLKKIWEKIDHREYVIAVTEKNDFYQCIVQRIGRNNYDLQVFKAGMPGDWCYAHCSCGTIQKDSVPCHHLMAVVKSGRAAGLTMQNVIPALWRTTTWQGQIPEEGVVHVSFDIRYLQDKYLPNNTVRYCPDFVAANKSGHPKKNRHRKSASEQALEANNKKRKRVKKNSKKIISAESEIVKE